MFDAVVSASLQYIDEANNIAVDIGMRVGQTVTNTSLGSQIAYPVEFLPFKKRIKVIAVLEL